jgi:hypothetical protein
VSKQNSHDQLPIEITETFLIILLTSKTLIKLMKVNLGFKKKKKIIIIIKKLKNYEKS